MTDGAPGQLIQFTTNDRFQDDEARSLLFRKLRPGTIIRLFDHPAGDTSDDWVEILVMQEAGDPGQDFYFPNFILDPGLSCRIYTDENHPEYCSFSFGSGQEIWNNRGDCGYLYDDEGAQVSKYCYKLFGFNSLSLALRDARSERTIGCENVTCHPKNFA